MNIMDKHKTLLFFCIFSVCSFHPGESQDDQTEFVYGYQVINWCIVGKVEPPLFEWPLVQLKPFLLKTQQLGKYEDFKDLHDPILISPDSDEYDDYKKEVDVAITEPEPPPPTYTLEFKRIKCSHEENIGYINGADRSTFHNRMHIQLKIDQPGDPDFKGVEGLVIQANHGPYGFGFPFGQFDNGEDVQCACNFQHAKIIPCLSRPDIEILAPTVAAFHYQLPRLVRSVEANKSGEEFPKALQETGKQTEFHFNFKWNDSPCSPASIVEFWILIIHDFYRRKYEIKKFGPYTGFHSDLPSTAQHNRPDPTNQLKWSVPIEGGPTRFVQQPLFAPSPLFPKCREGNVDPPDCVPVTEANVEVNPTLTVKECKEQYFVECHGSNYGIAEGISEDKTKASIRINGLFDAQCVARYVFHRAYRQCPDWTAKMRCFGEYSDLKRLDRIREKRTNSTDPFFPDTFCLPCEFEPTTEFSEPKETGPPFFKRTLHGALMILAFFYLLPLSGIIGRFYKETFHDVELKGWRLWLWIHVGSSIFLMCICYASYNLPTFWELDRHMYWGYGALFSGALGLITGWGRHKSTRGLKYMFAFHALTGYCAWLFAAISFTRTPASTAAKVVIIFSIVALVTIMLALSCHVCAVDNKLGVKPNRSHMPILQVRFEDAFVPGHKFRRIFFYVVAGVLFVIISTTFCI